MSPEEVLERWAALVNSGDVRGVTELYSRTFTLLPTFSPREIVEESDLKKYFQKIADMPDGGVDLQQSSLRRCDLSDSVCVLSGEYTFHLNEAGTVKSVPSRFTFVIDLSLEKPIAHHHSSRRPAE